MNCQIIFYMAQKTGYCEKTLRRKFKNSQFKIAEASGAATVKELGVCLASAVSDCNFIIILGGLSKTGNENITHVLSRAFSQTTASLQIKKIINPIGGDDGYILESGEQIILVLPDSPEHIYAMVGNSLLKYLSNFFKLSFEPAPNEPNIDVLLTSDGGNAVHNKDTEKAVSPSASTYGEYAPHGRYAEEYDGDYEPKKAKSSGKWLYVLAVIAAIITVGVVICDVMILKRFY